MSETSSEHEARARRRTERAPVRCAVLTVSDSRTPETDASGDLAARLLEAAGHTVAVRDIVPDDPRAIRARLDRWLADPEIHAVVTSGGTGIGRRDTTVDVIRSIVTVDLEGFGELFRMLSYQRIKGAAMLSRAHAGFVLRETDAGGDTIVFAVPGSPDAVETAVANLIAPQLAHLIWERRR